MPITDLLRTSVLNTLGFKEEPFSPIADPRYLYLSTQHGDVLMSAQRAIDEYRGLLVVEGAYGVGKSTVARRMELIYRGYPDEYFVVYVQQAKYETEYAALSDISTACGLPRRKGITQQWRELENFLVQQKGLGRNVVIIMDDVQLMSPDALSAVHSLYNFEAYQKTAQVILFGQQPKMHSIFAAREEVLSRVYTWDTLRPLSFPDSYELIHYRANVAGRKEPFISQSQFIRVWEQTGGIPRNIVNICSLMIEEVGKQSKRGVDDEVVGSAIERYRAKLAVLASGQAGQVAPAEPTQK
jgi:general secretion pathway protein A